MILGVTATSLTFVALLVSTISYFLYHLRREENLLQLARIGFYTASVLIVFQSILLMYGILTHHFEWTYVFSYSSRDLSLYYLISTFWAGQEGTFLMWTLMGTAYGLFIIRKDKDEEPLVMGFMNLVQAFIIMILVKKNPFAFVWQTNPSAFPAGVTPLDGSGLNPLLQDPWMTIHPPILFIGYSSSMILFSFAMAALIKKNYDHWIKPAYPYMLFVGVALGTGIILGGYWAYTTLGWGGFWGWDPVENSSFIPWLTALALIHGVIIQRARGALKKTNIALALTTFVLVLYGTFLTRSGALTDFSVHSFGESELNTYLTAFVLLFLVIGLLTFLLRSGEVKSEKVQSALFSRESFIHFGIMALILFAVLTFFGTSSPIITGILGTASNVSTDYYNTIAGPLAILMGLLIALAPRMTWKRNSSEKLQSLVWHFAISLLAAIFSFVLGMRDILPLLITTMAFFMMVVNGELVIKMLRRKNYKFGGYLVHFGVGLMLIGIVTSSMYDTSQKTTLPLNTKVNVLGIDLEYQGRIPQPNKKDMVRININGAETHGKYYWSDYSRAFMVGPAVENTLLRDFYVSPIQIIPAEENRGSVSKVQIKKGQTVTNSGLKLQFEKFEMGAHGMSSGDIHLAALVNILDEYDKVVSTIKPALVMKGQERELLPASTPDSTHQVFIDGINVDNGSIRLAISSNASDSNPHVGKELLAVEVSVKPLINLLWVGTVFLIIGFFLAISANRKRAIA